MGLSGFYSDGIGTLRANEVGKHTVGKLLHPETSDQILENHEDSQFLQWGNFP